MNCTLPPEGWYCTREAPHEGPCAAVPNTTQETTHLQYYIVQGKSYDKWYNTLCIAFGTGQEATTNMEQAIQRASPTSPFMEWRVAQVDVVTTTTVSAYKESK